MMAMINPDLDLIMGYLMIAAASTPYALSLFFPSFFLKNFFLPIYKDDGDGRGRDAEIAWNTCYATLGLVLTILVGLEVWLAPKCAIMGVAHLCKQFLTQSLMSSTTLGKLCVLPLAFAKMFMSSMMMRCQTQSNNVEESFTSSVVVSRSSTLPRRRQRGVASGPSKRAIAYIPAYESASRLMMAGNHHPDLDATVSNNTNNNNNNNNIKQHQDGREAEISNKTRYATFGLVVTTLVRLLEACSVASQQQPAAAAAAAAAARQFCCMTSTTILRGIYMAWALFYANAFWKIQREAKDGILSANQLGIQLWHCLVVFVLWADLSQAPLAKLVIAGIKRWLSHVSY